VQAQARLRQAQPLGGAGEISQPRHRNEDAQLMQIDIH
jgi:hypothetical protein